MQTQLSFCLLFCSLGSLGAGSDFAPFIHFLGITAMDIAYTYDRVSLWGTLGVGGKSLAHQIWRGGG